MNYNHLSYSTLSYSTLSYSTLSYSTYHFNKQFIKMNFTYETFQKVDIVRSIIGEGHIAFMIVEDSVNINESYDKKLDFEELVGAHIKKTTTFLNTKPVVELKNLCKMKKIPCYTKCTKKAEYIDLIIQHDPQMEKFKESYTCKSKMIKYLRDDIAAIDIVEEPIERFKLIIAMFRYMADNKAFLMLFRQVRRVLMSRFIIMDEELSKKEERYSVEDIAEYKKYVTILSSC